MLNSVSGIFGSRKRGNEILRMVRSLKAFNKIGEKVYEFEEDAGPEFSKGVIFRTLPLRKTVEMVESSSTEDCMRL